ncbi:MAG: hypothetical protein LC643_06880 [Bacteroidales bacterium]|nr:hypothetical protein [Bacteroidales bacterium]
MVVFPIANKPTAILKGSYIILILIVIFTSLYIHFQTINIIIAFSLIFVPTVIYLITYIKKQSIKSLQLGPDKLIVTYKKKTIEIPISHIQEISSGVYVGFDLKFCIIKRYTIHLNTKQEFGRNLLIEYNFDKPKVVSIKEDHIQIKILNAMIKSLTVD